MAALFAVAAATAIRANASDDMLIIEQDYNILENAKEGMNARDIRQVLYVTRDAVCIDEYGSGGKAPSESYLIDLKNQRIVNLDHDKKSILVNESFDERRERLAKKKKEIEGDIAELPNGAQRSKIINLYKAMLDSKRDFALDANAGTRKVAGVECKLVKITDRADAKYTAIEAALHPELDMPYDNSEVLFLLKIIGENMAKFLKNNVGTFARVPMEMHIDLAAGGKLDTKVVSVKKIKAEAFDPKSRALGDPYLVPADYTAPKPRLAPAAPVESPKKERAD